MTLNLEDLAVTTFATGPVDDDPIEDSRISRGCPQSLHLRSSRSPRRRLPGPRHG